MTVNFATDDGTARCMSNGCYSYCFHLFTMFYILSTAGQDYMETATSLVIFDQSSVSVPVAIINDDQLETPENFFGLLISDGELPPNVQLAPTPATATILDDECETSQR